MLRKRTLLANRSTSIVRSAPPATTSPIHRSGAPRPLGRIYLSSTDVLTKNFCFISGSSNLSGQIYRYPKLLFLF